MTSKAKILPLNVSAFTGVDNLTLFIQCSTGGDIVAISKIEFYGETVESVDVGELKKVMEKQSSQTTFLS